MTVGITRRELGAGDLRREARRCRDGAASRRMLALALVLEGASREEAARAAGMDRQTLRDWVHRYNAEGLAGLRDRRRPGPGAAARPHPGQRALLADAGLILEPDLDRLAAGVLGQRLAYQIGEAFLNASCAASSAFGCRGLTETRLKPSRRSTLPTERSCRRTAKRVSISAFRSTRRQRTTASRSGSGPRSTAVTSSASCSGESRGLGPGRRRSWRPGRPSSL